MSRAPARRMCSSDSIITRSRSIQPFAAAASICEYARQGEDLARHVDLLHEPRVRDDRPSPPDSDLLKKSHRGQAREDEDGEVGNATGCLEKLSEDDEIDGQLHERACESPQESQRRVLVSRLEITLDEQVEHVPLVDDIAYRSHDFAWGEAANGTDRAERLVGESRESRFCDHRVGIRHGFPIL